MVYADMMCGLKSFKLHGKDEFLHTYFLHIHDMCPCDICLKSFEWYGKGEFTHRHMHIFK